MLRNAWPWMLSSLLGPTVVFHRGCGGGQLGPRGLEETVGCPDVIRVGAPPRGRNGAEVRLGSGTRDPDAKKGTSLIFSNRQDPVFELFLQETVKHL